MAKTFVAFSRTLAKQLKGGRIVNGIADVHFGIAVVVEVAERGCPMAGHFVVRGVE